MSDSAFVHHVTEADFQQKVLESSFQQPVLVDFWAEWCAPCQSLMPILTKLAEDYNGGFVLAKVNSDEQQNLAMQYGVRSLPTVKVFKNGQIVDEFMGALPEGEIRTFIDKHIVKESEMLFQQAIEVLQQGQQEQAMGLLNQALQMDPENVTLKINIASILFQSGDSDSAKALLESLSTQDKQTETAKELIAQMELAERLKDAPDPDELIQRIEKDPKDLQARYQLSDMLSATGRYEEAMEQLLKMMQINANFEEGAARKGLLALFDMLGGDNPLVKAYRRKMFTLLH